MPEAPNSVVEVALTGDYDMARADDLRQRLLDVDHPSVVVADLSGVTFLDSSGLQALLDVKRALASEGGQLQLRALPRPVTVLLEMTGTRNTFDIEVPDTR